MEMTIRQSTDNRRRAAGAAAGVLAAAAAVHAAWASGLTFPASSSRELAELVVGDRSRMPAAPVTWAVAGGLAVAAWGIAERTRARRLPPPWERWVCTGLRLVVILLALRGAGGFVWSAFGLADETHRFRFWNLVLYSPLCLALAAGAACVWTRPGSAGRVVGGR